MAIDFKSPIVKIPFGIHKGKLLWTRHISYWSWLENNGCTQDTRNSIQDAYELSKNLGKFAVLRKSKKVKFLVRLKCIYSSKAVAEANCENTDEWEDFVYHIDSGDEID